MIKTKKTKEILKEWRSFESEVLVESAKHGNLRDQASKFLGCDKEDFQDSSIFSSYPELGDELEFLIELLKADKKLDESMTVSDLVFTDDQTCSINFGNLPLDKAKDYFDVGGAGGGIPVHGYFDHNAFDLFYFKNTEESRNPFLFVFFPKSGSSASKQWHGKLKIGGKGR